MWREKIWILKKRSQNLRWAVLTGGFSLFSFWPVTKAGKRVGHPQLVDWSYSLMLGTKFKALDMLNTGSKTRYPSSC